MNKLLLTILCLMFIVRLNGVDNLKISQFLKKYDWAYQDVIVENKTILRGTNICPPRYDLLKQVLERHKNNQFSVLDIGACQGYFDFKIANDYPGAHCFMIEGKGLPKAMLIELCHLNSYLPNMTLFTKNVSTNDLNFLSSKHHFDVVLALLVLHYFAGKDDGYEKIIETVVGLGNDIIIEIPTYGYGSESADQILKKYNPIYLGTVNRSYSSKSLQGKIYWIERNKRAISLTLEPEIYEFLECAYYSKSSKN